MISLLILHVFRRKLLNFVLKSAVQFTLVKGGRLHMSKSISSLIMKEISPVFLINCSPENTLSLDQLLSAQDKCLAAC